ncbi:MAG: SH3 domain-containing protein [Clostridium sp.]|nr:SH3 domain-containing protein [Clostridium sp.]
MKKCSECGTQLKDDAKFCPKCGAKQTAEGPRHEEPPVSRRGEHPREAAEARVSAEAEPPKQPQASLRPEQAAQPQPAAVKKKSIMPFVVICLVLILAMGGGTAFYLWKLNEAGSRQEASAQADREIEEDDEEETEEPSGKPEGTSLAAEAATEATLPTEAPTTAAVPETAPMPTAAPTAPYVPETAAPVPADYTTLYVVNCDEFITLRSSASTSASELTKIPLGSVVSYVSTAENGFYKVIFNGKTGYALASYLSSDPYYYETPDTNGYPTMYVVNCDEFITLRSSDSTSASEITKIPLGAAVSYISTAGNGFYKIIYNGNTGYALASYLSY